MLAFENFILMMVVIFGLQFVDRSFGPVLPLYVEQVGVAARARARSSSGVLFSIMAFTGALGHHFCGRLLRRYTRAARDRRRRGGRGRRLRRCSALSGNVWMMCVGVGAASASASAPR